MKKLMTCLGRRILPLFLVCCMAVSLVPVTSFSGNAGAVEPTPVVIDFSQTTTTNASPFKIVTTPGYTVVESKSASALNRAITLPGTTDKAIRIGLAGRLWQDAVVKGGVQNAMFTISVDVPTAGYYIPKCVGGTWWRGVISSIYIDDIYAGDYSFWSGNATQAEAEAAGFVGGNDAKLGEEKTLNGFNLTAGSHEISFRSRWRYDTNYEPYFLLHKLTLVPAESASLESVASVLPESVYLGEPKNVSAQAMLSNGNAYQFGLTTNAVADTETFITISSSDSSILSVKNITSVKIGAGDTMTATLTPVAQGSATITVTAKVGGVTKTAEKSVTVSAPPTLSSVALALTPAELPLGRVSAASVTGLLTSGSTADLSTATIRYSSADPTIASVDADSGAITTLKEGSTEINVSVTLGGVTKTNSKTLTITPRPTLNTVALKLGALMLTPNTKTKSTVTGLMSDNVSADMTKYTVHFSSSDTSVAAIDPTSGEITALSEGETEITASADGESGAVTSKCTLTVVNQLPPVVVDFSKTTTTDTSPYKLLTTPGYTVVDGKYSELSNRAVVLPDGSEAGALRVGVSGRLWLDAIIKGGLENSMYTIKVSVPADGYYVAKLQGATWYRGVIASIYVDGEYAGDYNFWSGRNEAEATADFVGANDAKLAAEKTLNGFHLTAGSHEVSIRARWRLDTNVGPHFILHKLTLAPLATAPELSDIQSDFPSEITLGEWMSKSVWARTDDGNRVHFGLTDDGKTDTENTMSFSVKSGDSVSMSNMKFAEAGADDALTATFAPQKTGVTTFEATAKYRGETVTQTFTVNVVDDKLAETSGKTATEEVFIGDTVDIQIENVLTSGRTVDNKVVDTTIESMTPDIAAVTDGKLIANAVGDARLKITSTLAETTVVSYLDVEILPESLVSLRVTAGGSKIIRLAEGTVPLVVEGISNTGAEMNLDGATIVSEALTPEFATVDDSENITAIAEGEARFSVTLTLNGRVRSTEVSFPVRTGKTAPSLFALSEREIARENIQKYAWAKNELKTYQAKADIYIDSVDYLWSIIPSEGLPRSRAVGQEYDPERFKCRYCGVDLQAEYSVYAWKMNVFTRPWKLECPNCRRIFPTNDFGSFYKLGLNEYGEYNRERALTAHAELFGDPTAEVGSKAYYGYGKGYLKNILYSELENEPTLNCGAGLLPGESNDTWGVEDGEGYLTGRKYSNGMLERHTYIAYYILFGIWYTASGNTNITVPDAITAMGYTYAYTGEAKYGRAGAILLDRVADLYPDFDLRQWDVMTDNAHGGSGYGRISGCIYEANLGLKLATAYDLLFPAYDDPAVVSDLMKKSETVKMHHTKETPAQLRNNAEDGILRTINSAVRNSDISSNFGDTQSTIAAAAVALDSLPETGEWLDWLMAPGARYDDPREGGGIGQTLMDVIDRDGMGYEAAAYNVGWLQGLVNVAEYLDGYEKYPAADLYEHPKLKRMFYGLIPMIGATYYTPQVGDSGRTADSGIWMTNWLARTAYRKYGDYRFAQYAYMLNGNSTQGMHENIRTKNPEEVAKTIQKVVDEYGTLKPESDMLPAFGFAALHDGEKFKTAGEDINANSERTFWMYFGINYGHGHKDTLNLGMDAFGLNVLPELAYPATTDTSPLRLQWESATLIHNTVLVDGDITTERGYPANFIRHGYPQHFDDSGRVKVMDVDVPQLFSTASVYRRTVVMIEAGDDVSYGVDFFRILGGSDHIYSFHAQSDEIAETEGLTMTPQQDADGNYIGSYAGADIPFGPDPYSPAEWYYKPTYIRGTTWLDKVDRDANPDKTFAVDFKIKDFKNVLPYLNTKDMHLRLTMLCDSPLTEVAFANGYTPKYAVNSDIPMFRYMLARRRGENLDTLFTSVIEPYRGARYIAATENVDVIVKDGSPAATDVARAVKVTHTNGRIDYVVYATNGGITYRVGDLFDFRGFVGVYTVKDGEVINSYLHDGDILGESETGLAAVTGQVTDFTKELTDDNSITISAEQDIEPAALAGRFVFIENGSAANAVYRDGLENAVYRIKSAAETDGKIELKLGEVPLIRSYVDAKKPEEGYVYNIKEGQSFRIPLSSVNDDSPVFSPVASKTVSAGSSVSITVSATSPIGKALAYSEVSLPRGATFDTETATIKWKPDDSQVGEHHIAIAASDGGQESVQHISVRVLGSTKGGDGDGGGGGGGETPTEPAEPTEPTEPTTPTEPTIPEQNGFSDLDGYDWARDAIESLAADGIIKGLSDKIFAPGANITRADFAILLVRAFKLTSDSTDNFSDVSPSDYFASELAIAKNAGIIGGIGDNRYAPRNRITREDMMVIVYRALTKLGYALSDAETVAAYEDAEDISDYAVDAVATLIANDLITGANGKINPKATTTRAEVAVLLRRILNIEK